MSPINRLTLFQRGVVADKLDIAAKQITNLVLDEVGERHFVAIYNLERRIREILKKEVGL